MLHINFNSGLCPLFVGFHRNFANVIINCHCYSENWKALLEKYHSAILPITFHLLLTVCFLRLWSYRTLFEILFAFYCKINVYNIWVYLFHGVLFFVGRYFIISFRISGSWLLIKSFYLCRSRQGMCHKNIFY